MTRLFDLRMADGSRHFGDLPETYDAETPEWHRLREQVSALEGAELTGFVTDDVTEAWIDFRWREHAFSLNNQHGQWWFFVADPGCPDDLLVAVLDHFERLLDPAANHARQAGPIASGAFRAVVVEANGRVTHKDFGDQASARQYADDAASESEDVIVLAYVVDAGLSVVHRGRHY